MDVVVVGGGSAGLITSLILTNKVKIPINVKLIESPTEKIIGVGESTVGSFRADLENIMGIHFHDFIDEVQPTNKLGLWLSFGSEDFHFSFDNVFEAIEMGNDFPKPIGFRFRRGNFNHSQFSKAMIYDKQAYIPSEDSAYSQGFHMHNDKFIAFCKKELKNRGVEIITDHITDIKRDDKGNILSLNDKYHADLFIDASGFKSILSEEEWIDYSDALVNDSALVFTSETELRPYTKAITMNNGWMWQIDHLDKRVNGYVYSSKYATEKDILEELNNEHDYNVKDYKIIHFKTGRKAKHWVNNVITVGNADMFVEPLESTSLMCIIKCIDDVGYIINLNDKAFNLKEAYNEEQNEYYDNIRDFILLHFCYNERKQTKYWQDYNQRRSMLGKFGKKMVNYFTDNDASLAFTQWTAVCNPFGLNGWYSIMRGLDLRKSF